MSSTLHPLLALVLCVGCTRVVPLGSDLALRDDGSRIDVPDGDGFVMPPSFDVPRDRTERDTVDVFDAAHDVTIVPDVPRPTPTGTVTRLTAGERPSCALRSDGSVWCWGANEHGQLGDGTTTRRLSPEPVLGLSNVIDVVTGATHTCARTSSRRVFCWGQGTNGRLVAPGVTTDQLRAIDTGRDADQLAMGHAHTCMLDAGRIRCAGDNSDGALGALGGAEVALPMMATRIASGAAFVCAELVDRSLWCWGRNTEGQLGRGTLTPSGTPAMVPGLTNVSSLVMGARHACAVMGDAPWCWGDRAAGQLGDGVTGAPLATPTRMMMWGEAIPKVAGDAFTCGGDMTFAVCVGANDRGQLGDGTTMSRAVPSPVMRVVGAPRSSFGTVMSAGARHACVQLNGREEWCWGDGTDGQRGSGTVAMSPVPSMVRWD